MIIVWTGPRKGTGSSRLFNGIQSKVKKNVLLIVDINQVTEWFFVIFTVMIFYLPGQKFPGASWYISSLLQNDFSNLQRNSSVHYFLKMCFHGLMTFNIKLVLKIELKERLNRISGCCDREFFSLNSPTIISTGTSNQIPQSVTKILVA